MKAILLSLVIATLLFGCGEDIEVPKMINCDGCGKKVSSSGDFCTFCSHPVSVSIDQYLERRKKSISDKEKMQKKEEERLRKEKEELNRIWRDNQNK